MRFLFALLLGGMISSPGFSIDYGYGVFPAGKDLDFGTLEKEILKKKITTLPRLLSVMKENDPALFDQYLLAHRSRSLQESSPLFPRVILIANEAQFLMAYNGHPDHSGFNHLETVEFKPKTRSFVFREIEFKTDGSAPRISEPNPARCLKCHQSPSRVGVDPRPNWEPYSFWPGFYGAGNSFKSKADLEEDYRLREEDRRIFNEIINERATYEKFERFTKPASALYGVLGKFDFKRTVFFTASLSNLNLQRVLRLTSQESAFETYKPVFFSALKCGEFYWPKHVDEAHFNGSDLIETQRIKTLRGLHKEEEPDFLPYGVKLPHPGMLFSISQVLTSIFEPLGVSTEDWSMDFRTERGRLAFVERFGGPDRAEISLLRMAERQWPEMAEKSCDELKRMGQSANYDLSKIQTRIPLAGRDVVKKCLGCHGEMESQWHQAPSIPFDSKEKMAEFLREKGIGSAQFFHRVQFKTGAHATLRDQMPPGESLDVHERKALLEYLKTVLEP